MRRNLAGTHEPTLVDWPPLTIGMCCMQLRFALFQDVLTPVQMALIYAKTYPLSVDVVTMAKCGLTGSKRLPRHPEP